MQAYWEEIQITTERYQLIFLDWLQSLTEMLEQVSLYNRNKNSLYRFLLFVFKKIFQGNETLI